MTDENGRYVFPRTRKLRNWIRDVEPTICTERATIFTDSWKSNAAAPLPIRKAKAMADYLASSTISIRPEEVIVGNYAELPKSAPVTPESVSTWMEKELDTFTDRIVDRFRVTPEARKILMEDVFPYWREQTVEARVEQTMPEETRRVWKHDHTVINCSTFARNYSGHYVADIQKVCALGFRGIMGQVKAMRDRLDDSDPEAVKKREFYEAEMIAAQACIDFGNRYAKLAEKMAEQEKDPERKKELQDIARVCRQVPGDPARNFHEAVQTVWFVQLLLQLEGDGTAVSVERFDKLLDPYYQRDKAAGRIDYAAAQALVEMLWVKMYEIMKAYDQKGATFFAGYNVGQTLTIGGVNPRGKDDTNEVSFIVMDAENNIRTTQPNLEVRVNKNTPDSFLMRVCEHIIEGTGKPPVFNDECIIPGLLHRGVRMEEARDYALIGCVEPTPKGMAFNWTNAGFFNLAKCLEYALNDGICRLSGQQIGLKTGRADQFSSMADLVAAYQAQVAYFARHLVIALNTFDKAHSELLPLPILSLVMDDCIEKGVDVTAGGARYNFISPQGVGVADVADSLAAVEKWVFEEKKYTLQEINEGLNKDFKGFERMRRDLMNAPKYGNDDDAADQYAIMAADQYCAEIEKYKNPRGGDYQPGLFSVSSNVGLGVDAGALPSGRCSGTPLADGLSPAPGMDSCGPTAVLHSVTKIDHGRASNGTLLNQKFSRSALETPEGLEKFMQYIRTYILMGGHQIQVNVIDGKTLTDAQAHPEKYRNLMVRVAGYSAFFTELHPALQDALIARTEHDHV